MKRREIHVVYVPKGNAKSRQRRYRGWWAVIRGGGKRHEYWASKMMATAWARTIAKRCKLELVIHGRDSRIQDSDTFGHEGRVRDRVH